MAKENQRVHTEILENLKKNYLFKLSLGSKELFHSNFLEMLWEMDNNLFITMLRQLTGKKELLSAENTTYYLSREKENFDICIYHEISSRGDNKKPIYDLIIENKVKSIPHQAQLKTYEKKVAKNNHLTNNRKGKNKEEWDEPCAYILLSLVTKFSEKEKIDKDRVWTIRSYDDMFSAIEKIYTEDKIKNLFLEKKDKEQEAKEYIELITKYKDFIKNLHTLQLISNKDFLEKPLFDEDTIEEFKGYRLHDLYIKHSCGLFADELMQRLQLQLNNVIKIFFLSDIKEIDKTEYDIDSKPCIFIHEEMLNVEGSVGVSICPQGRKGIDYQIIIQGKQYRHCICRNKTNGENNEKLWDAVKDNPFLKSLNINETLGVSYNFGGQGRDKEIKCCSYTLDKSLFVYKYIKIGEDNFPKLANDLLNVMVNDIINTCAKKINNQYESL